MNDKSNCTIPVIRSDHHIPIEIHNEYIAYHNDVDLEREKKAADEMVSTVFNPQATLEEKKRALFVFGHCGTLESYNALKRYCDAPNQDLVAWAMLCLNESRSWLVGEILEEDSEIVMTGAGGDGARLRFYFIVGSKDRQTITPLQQKIAFDVVKSTTKKTDVALESLSFAEHCVLLTLLIPPDIAPGEMIERIINECNNNKSFLRFHYFVSNVQQPSKDDILQYLSELP